jgi:hypothetical protein
MTDSWQFDLAAKIAGYEKLKPGTCFKVEIIGTWEMTIRTEPQIFEIAELKDYRIPLFSNFFCRQYP